MFCCHGGIPPPWLCPKASAINDIPSPLSLPDQQSQLAWNLMWNDPANPNLLNDAMRRELQLNDGFAKNTRRGTGFIFNAQAMDAFLTRNNFTHLIRAHELQPYGINVMCTELLEHLISLLFYFFRYVLEVNYFLYSHRRNTVVVLMKLHVCRSRREKFVYYGWKPDNTYYIVYCII